jgi:hypothetical protein
MEGSNTGVEGHKGYVFKRTDEEKGRKCLFDEEEVKGKEGKGREKEREKADCDSSPLLWQVNHLSESEPLG